MRTPAPQSSAGFSLIEALIALVIMAFGLLSLTSLQISLSRNADLAKQRTEALRLAQDRIERMRAYDGISTGTVTWDSLSSSSEVVSSYSVGGATTNTNASYTVTWTLGGTNADQYRALQVQVGWTDRTGQNQTVALNTVISQSDPMNVGSMNFPLPQNTNLKRPKDRNLNIPIQAIDLGSGRSAYRISNTFQIIFNNTTGGVIRICQNLDATGSNYATATCSNVPGYIVAGYVSGAILPTSGTPTSPTGINTSGITGNYTIISCDYKEAPGSTASSPFHYYICVIPVDPSTGNGFSGTLKLGGVNTSSNYIVCRIQYLSSTYTTPAERNEQPYVNVKMSLDNQNYKIMNASDGTCTPALSANVPNNTTIVGTSVPTYKHQDCRSGQSPTTGNTGTCPATVHNTLLATY